MSRERRAVNSVYATGVWRKVITMKARRLFTTSVWSAVALALSGVAVADTASAADGPGRQRSERQMNERFNGPVQRMEQRQERPMRSFPDRQARQNAPDPARTMARPQAPTPDRQPARDWAQGRAQIAQEAQRGDRTWNRGDSGSRGTGWNRGDSGDRSGSWNRGDNRSDATRDRRDDARRPDYSSRDRYNNNRSTWQTDRRGDWRSDRNDRRGDRDNWRGDRRADRGDYRNWDRNSWRRDNRYDWRSYRARNRSAYSIGRYYAPYRNYSYRRLSIGFSLGSMFYGNRYWINDPWSYRLPEVYGPYRWVRYYDDVLLVDVYSGRVVDVIYDFFW